MLTFQPILVYKEKLKSKAVLTCGEVIFTTNEIPLSGLQSRFWSFFCIVDPLTPQAMKVSKDNASNEAFLAHPMSVGQHVTALNKRLYQTKQSDRLQES